MKRYLLYILALAAVGLLLVYWQLSPFVDDRISARFGADVEISVKVVRVKKVSLVRVIDIVGELQPLNEIQIISQLPGIVKEVRYKIGNTVPAGAVVATIQSKELTDRLGASEAAVKEAEGNLRARESQIATAEKELATLREWLQRDLIARRDVEEAEATANRARAEKEVAQAQLAQRRSMLDQARYLLTLTRLVVPFAGVVTRRSVEPGATVSPATVILSIAKPDAMRVSVPLTGEDANLATPGMTVRFRIDNSPGRQFEAKLTQIEVSSEPTDRAAIAEIHLSNPDGLLKPGMKAVVSLPISEPHEALVVPKESIAESSDKSYLYTIVAGKAVRKAVIKGVEQNGRLVITSGLEEGELVIITGLEKLRPGSRVRALE